MRVPNTTCCKCAAPIYRRPRQIATGPVYCAECVRSSDVRSAAAHKRTTVSDEVWIAEWQRGERSGICGKIKLVSQRIRRYLYKKYDNRCCRCGWSKVNTFTNKVPLEIEHKDGNAENNTEENLELLCPNCHSLTATYKGANKGRGRKSRFGG